MKYLGYVAKDLFNMHHLLMRVNKQVYIAVFGNNTDAFPSLNYSKVHFQLT